MYKQYSEYLRELFGPGKVQKLSVNAGLGCPNRDGTIGRGGCSYCSNTSFTPAYCLDANDATRPGGVADQIARGREFFAHKYPAMRYLAYFQSYTSTFLRDTDTLRRMYEEALSQPGVVGLIIGTRPDCLPLPILEIIADLARRHVIMVELGAETCHDDTLRRVNRGHTWRQVIDAVEAVTRAGAHVGLHLIAGLPGEREEDILESVSVACELPIGSIKLHQLQIIKGTPLHREWQEGKADVISWTAEEYMKFCTRIIEIVPKTIAIERFLASAPPELVVSPRWGLKNHVFTDRLHNLLRHKSELN